MVDDLILAASVDVVAAHDGEQPSARTELTDEGFIPDGALEWPAQCVTHDVQWHPEDSPIEAIFREFVSAAVPAPNAPTPGLR